MDNMTIKELAQVAGVSGETIRRTAKSLFPDYMKKGVTAKFSKRNSLMIIEEVKKKNMVAPIQQPIQTPPQSVEVIAQAVAIAMQSVMMPMMEKLLSNQKALPEPVKQDSYSLVAYCRVKGITVNQSELAVHGMALRKIANRKNIKLNKIPDERWGFVNSYPITILDEYFAA